MANFGVLQKNARESYVMPDGRKMSQQDLVEKLAEYKVDTTQGYVGKIETTDTIPRCDYIAAICRIFNTHSDYWVGLTSRPVPLDKEPLPPEQTLVTPEARTAAAIIDALPPEQRKMLLKMTEMVKAATELANEKEQLENQWDEYWKLVEKLGGLSLRARIERDLGISGGAGGGIGIDDVLLDAFEQRTHDGAA